MVALEFDFGPEITEVRDWLDRKRRDRAIAAAQKHLRAGYASREFLRLVADLMEQPRKAGRGRSPSLPARWFQKGELFERLREEGLTYEQALQRVADEEGSSTSDVRRAHKHYRDGMDERSRMDREWLEDEAV